MTKLRAPQCSIRSRRGWGDIYAHVHVFCWGFFLTRRHLLSSSPMRTFSRSEPSSARPGSPRLAMVLMSQTSRRLSADSEPEPSAVADSCLGALHLSSFFFSFAFPHPPLAAPRAASCCTRRATVVGPRPAPVRRSATGS